MSENIEKVYTCGTDPAVLASLMRDNGNDASTMAMLASNNNNMNPMWLIWLIAMRWLGNNNDGQNSEIESLRNQIADNQNSNNLLSQLMQNGNAMQEIANRTNTSIDFVRESLSNLGVAISNVSGQIGLSSERVVNSVLLGNKDITAMMQSCCCENKQLVTQQGYENRIATLQSQAALNSRIDQLANGVTQGFSAMSYENAKLNNDAIQANSANTQRILDALTQHWQSETALALQDQKFKVSQLEQNQYLVNALKNTCGCGNN